MAVLRVGGSSMAIRYLQPFQWLTPPAPLQTPIQPVTLISLTPPLPLVAALASLALPLQPYP